MSIIANQLFCFCSLIYLFLASYTHELNIFGFKTSLYSKWRVNLPELEELDISFSYLFELCLGTASNTLFWLDDWFGQGILASRFPFLFGLDKRKSCFVSERLTVSWPIWSWKKMVLCSLEVAELHNLYGLVSSVFLSNKPDTWRSKLLKDENFYVKDLNSLNMV